MSRERIPVGSSGKRPRLAYGIVHAIRGCKPLQPVHLDSGLKTGETHTQSKTQYILRIVVKL